MIEMWDSEENAKRFLAERLGPAAEAIGALPSPPPEFYPVLNYMTE